MSLTLRRALNDPERCQDVVAHRFIFCDAAQQLPTEDLIQICWCCHRFLAYCCACTQRQLQAKQARRRAVTSSSTTVEPPRSCHYYKIVFVDGACLGNGQTEATAGIGIAIGLNPETMQWAIPIDDEMDPSAVRTSQRAELLAAIHGIRKLAEYEDYMHVLDSPGERHPSPDGEKTWIITSDSEYVVLGMTEWVPAWKSHRWRNSSQRRPKNLDLFQTLDATVERYERKYDIRIAFWRIGRDHNKLADLLAGSAARGEAVMPIQFDPIHFPSDEEMETESSC